MRWRGEIEISRKIFSHPLVSGEHDSTSVYTHYTLFSHFHFYQLRNPIWWRSSPLSFVRPSSILVPLPLLRRCKFRNVGSLATCSRCIPATSVLHRNAGLRVVSQYIGTVITYTLYALFCCTQLHNATTMTTDLKEPASLSQTRGIREQPHYSCNYYLLVRISATRLLVHVWGSQCRWRWMIILSREKWQCYVGNVQPDQLTNCLWLFYV